MNKKLKVFLALTLVIQLFVPVFLLAYHHSLLSTAKSLDTEYSFELDAIFLDYYYDFKAENPTERKNAPLTFNIYEIASWGNSRYTVRATPKNNVIGINKTDSVADTDTWFYGRYFDEICKIEYGKYSFSEGVDGAEIRAQLRTEYNVNLRGDREPAYLTAKIYKGVIIPTSIYFRGEKIIDINL